MPTIGSLSGSKGFGIISRPGQGRGGAMSFNGSTSNLSIANDADIQLGTGDFTIEFFIFILPAGPSFPRIFSVGSLSSGTVRIAMSIEGTTDTNRTIYLWATTAISIQSGNYLNEWVHIAISRTSGTMRVFIDGVQAYSAANTNNLTNSTDVLRIGNQSSTSAESAFKGYLTNFRWIKGTGLYTANFSKPQVPLTAVTNTKILLLATTSGAVTTDSSSVPKTVTNTSVTWLDSDPF